MSWTAVAVVGELQDEGLHGATVDGVELVVCRTGSGLRVFEGRCPHQGALLAEGELEDGHLVCRNHRWRFNAETGRRAGGPQRLRPCASVEREGELFADVSALRPRACEQNAAPTRRLADLPGPRGLPLLGSIFALRNDRAHVRLEKWAAQYGPLYVTRVGTLSFLVVADPQINAEILKARPDTFRRLGKLEPVFAELGASGVFTAEGDAWRPQRKLAMQALSTRAISGFYPALKTVTERLLRHWDVAARTGTAIDIHDDFRRFTVDVTTWLAFGYDVNSIERGGGDIQRKLELIFPAMIRRTNALLPYWRLFRLPYDRRLDRAVSELQSWLTDLIKQTRARMLDEPHRAERPGTFLEAMLTARDDSGAPFPSDVILGNAMTMLLAGEDTTSNTLAWAVHLLCDSPGVVETLHAELAERIPHDPLPPNLQAANQLEFADAISFEVMRLRPAAPLLPMQANQDTIVGNVAVPKGTPITLLTRYPVLDDQAFAVPRVFEPERWLANPRSSGAHEPSTHIPFGTGPRICPGRALALLEMRVALAALYKNFTVARVGQTSDVSERFALTMAPKGLRIRLHRRTDRD